MKRGWNLGAGLATKCLKNWAQIPRYFYFSLKPSLTNLVWRRKTPLWGGPVIYPLLFSWKLSIWHPFFEPFKVPPREWVGGGVGTATTAAATGFWTAMFWRHFWSITSPTISELLDPSAHSSTARYFGSLWPRRTEMNTHAHFLRESGIFSTL